MTVDNEREGLKVLFYVPQEPFFLREIMTENLHFFNTFSNRHNTRLRTFLIFAGAKSVFVGPNLTMVSKILVVQPAQIRYIGVEALSHKPLF